MQILHLTHLVLKVITTHNSYSTETRICIEPRYCVRGIYFMIRFFLFMVNNGTDFLAFGHFEL